MKLLLTTIATDTFDVTQNGKTVGELVNEVIRSNLAEGLQVTNVAVELTQEDMIALKMIMNTPIAKSEKKPSYDTQQNRR